MGRPSIDMTGKKFGKLLVLCDTGKRKNKQVMWKCQCDCGEICIIRGSNLRSGNTKSCGCSQRDHFKNNTYNKKHGHTKLENRWKSPTYRSWCKMKDRCLYPDERTAQYYNRDMLCERWLGFENFLADMGERPDDCEIHRIDNNKGYEPNNCEWKNRILHRQQHIK